MFMYWVILFVVPVSAMVRKIKYSLCSTIMHHHLITPETIHRKDNPLPVSQWESPYPNSNCMADTVKRGEVKKIE
jgi:hypothetical protein